MAGENVFHNVVFLAVSKQTVECGWIQFKDSEENLIVVCSMKFQTVFGHMTILIFEYFVI